MKVTEFVEIMNENKAKLSSRTDANAVTNFVKKTLNTKEYLPLQEKKDLISRIIDTSIIYENSMYKFDEIDKYVSLVMFSIETYTDIELSDNIEDDYDVLAKNGLLATIIDSFDTEYQSVTMLLSMQSNYVLSDNALGAKFGSLIDNLSKHIDNLSNILQTKIEEVNLDMSDIDLNEINSLLEKFK